LGIESAHVYGVSLGGMVAQELALRFPERVRGLVLGGTGAGGPRSVLPSPRAYAGFGKHALDGGARARWLGGALFSPQYRREHPQDAKALLRLLGAHRAPLHGTVGHWWASATHDTSGRLAQVQAPTLVLHGERDALVPLANAEHLARRVPDAELAVLPGAGHAYLWEQPERSAELLLGWLARRGPIAPGQALTGVARAVEPLTRALAVPLGGLRGPRTFTGLVAGQLRRRGGGATDPQTGTSPSR
ncbi:MAG: dienelactone hydrolase family protein, partial [Frankiales bacterium]|nr:dienelactone hydrolase family protein [Frankiales bacterium]